MEKILPNTCLIPWEVTAVRTKVVVDNFPNFWLGTMCTGVVINVSAVVMIEVGVNMLPNAEIIVVAAAAVGFKFVVEVTYTVETLAGV